MPSHVFKLAFVVFTLLIAIRMLFGGENWHLGDRLPGLPMMWAIGFITGLQSAIMGTGGGSISTLALMLYGTPIHVAVGISAGVGVIISIVGTIGYVLAGLPQQQLLPPLSLGFVSMIGLVLMAPISAAVAPFGAGLAHRMSKRQLEIGFGLFLLAVAFVSSSASGEGYGVPRITSRSPRTSQLSNRLRKLMPSRLVLSWPGCAISAGTARSTMSPTTSRSSVTAAARARPLAVSTVTV
jgi:hypothetical protein